MLNRFRSRYPLLKQGDLIHNNADFSPERSYIHKTIKKTLQSTILSALASSVTETNRLMYDRLWPHASLALVTPYSVFGISRALIPSPSPSSYSLLSTLLFRLPTLFPPLSLLHSPFSSSPSPLHPFTFLSPTQKWISQCSVMFQNHLQGIAFTEFPCFLSLFFLVVILTSKSAPNPPAEGNGHP